MEVASHLSHNLILKHLMGNDPSQQPPAVCPKSLQVWMTGRSIATVIVEEPGDTERSQDRSVERDRTLHVAYG